MTEYCSEPTRMRNTQQSRALDFSEMSIVL
jgi:hypothetical protein